MKKGLRLLQSIVLGVLILGCNAYNAKAFFLIPPMPWDVEIDIPGNANKIVSNAQAIYRQLQTIQSELNTNKLEAIKKGIDFALEFTENPEGETKKAPGKSNPELKNNETLKITKNGMDEKENFDAFHKLFVVYPLEKQYNSKHYNAVKMAFKRKGIEYKQDMVMETYMTGRMTEDFLRVVETTIERLDRCQKGEEKNNCKFFGMQMSDVNPNQSEEDLDPENPDNGGQYAEMMNAYIVSVVYDKLMRIVEDLVATETIFTSARQLDIIQQIEQDKQSSAEEYINREYQFAYSENQSYTYAKGTPIVAKDYQRSEVCQNGGGENCPELNKEQAKLKNVDDSAILGALQPIEAKIDEALQLHNLKASLGEYKSQYRKYLKAKEIHERLLKVLEESDKSVVNFMNKYGDGKGVSIWYGGSKPNKVNNHEARDGVSKEVIEEYQKYTTDTLIGTSGECSGYYETCPDGYKADTENPCKENPNMFPCIVDTVTSDMDSETPAISYNQTEIPQDFTNEAERNKREYNDTDFLKDGTDADRIEIENRIKAEKSWRIGANKIMELTNNGVLQFSPWNDQMDFQAEYMRNKYRNIRMIIQAIDKGMMSYRIATGLAEDEKNVGPIEFVLPAVTSCKLTTDATEDAYRDFCSGYSGKNCTESSGKKTCIGTKIVTCNSAGEPITDTVICRVEGDNSTGYINGAIISTKCPGYYKTKKYDQRIISKDGGCRFTKAKSVYTVLETNDNCPGEWDFRVSSLVKKYMPAVLGSWKSDGSYEQICKMNDLDVQTKHLRKQTYEAGRRVASDDFQNVLEVRKNVEESLIKLIMNYDNEQKQLKRELENIIKTRSDFANKLSDATDEKNEAVELRQEALRRVSSITTQIAELEARVKALQDQLNTTEDENTKILLEKEINSIEKGMSTFTSEQKNEIKNPTRAQEIGQIPALKEERNYICYKANTNKYEECKGFNEKEITEDLYANNEDNKFFPISELEANIAKAQTEIDSAETMMETLQEDINTKKEEIEKSAETFAKKYLEEAEKGYVEIEEANKKFENKLEAKEDGSEPDRMESIKRGYYPSSTGLPITEEDKKYEYDKDNLSWTMARVMFGGGTENSDSSVQNELPKIVKDTMDDRWFTGEQWKSDAAAKLKNVGVVKNFVIAEGALEKYGISDATYTPETLALALKDESVEQAANLLAGYIKNADEIVDDEIKAATEEVDYFRKELKITGEDGEEPDASIYERNNYANDNTVCEEDMSELPEITQKHCQLIKKLSEAKNKEELEGAEIKLTESFGIPNPIKTDDNYFVGLPARGTYDNPIPSYGLEVGEMPQMVEDLIDRNDENAGRDFMAPHKPMVNLPPLREIFYFSAQDYVDVPKYIDADKLEKPSKSTLVDKKFKGTYNEVEYLPEIWRYLLATPNLRGDELYQHTFVERAYDNSKLKDMLERGLSSDNYTTIISRAGVYPCKLGGVIIDIKGKNNDVNAIKFRKRTAGVESGYDVPTCQDIELYGTGVRHLLADHDSINDSKSKAIEKNISTMNDGMFSEVSELALFLNKSFQYRGVLGNMYKYLLKKENAENDIKRQKIDLATYKRNLIGSFLDSVNAEHNAEKTMNENEKDVEDALKSLCTQLHNFGESVDGESCEDKNDTGCPNKIAESCAIYIMKNGGLASSAEDDNYNVDCKKQKRTSYYDEIFCKLDELKDNTIEEAKFGYREGEEEIKGFESVKNMTGNDKAQERIQRINNYLEAFDADKEEVSVITPDSTADKVKEAVKEAEANQKASRAAEEEGIKSMDNQSRATAYAPVMKEK